EKLWEKEVETGQLREEVIRLEQSVGQRGEELREKEEVVASLKAQLGKEREQYSLLLSSLQASANAGYGKGEDFFFVLSLAVAVRTRICIRADGVARADGTSAGEEEKSLAAQYVAIRRELIEARKKVKELSSELTGPPSVRVARLFNTLNSRQRYQVIHSLLQDHDGADTLLGHQTAQSGAQLFANILRQPSAPPGVCPKLVAEMIRSSSPSERKGLYVVPCTAIFTTPLL
ncbi:MAG: hypothetical protein SGPRY_003133, partial [Prymnesium sp.]